MITMSELQGWISLYRKLQNHWLWQNEVFTKGQAWIDLMLRASHKEHKFMFNGTLTNQKRGEFITSLNELGNDWGWSRHKVRDFLEVLKQEQMLDFKTEQSRFTRISLCNYELHQDIDLKAYEKGQAKGTQKGLVKDKQRTGEGQVKDIINNGNNDNNEYNNIIYSQILTIWNQQNIIKHNKLTGRIIKAINGRLGEGHTSEEIIDAITNYGKIVADNKTYYFNYKWTLDLFLKRANGFPMFTNWSIAHNNCLRKENLNANPNQTAKTRDPDKGIIKGDSERFARIDRKLGI